MPASGNIYNHHGCGANTERLAIPNHKIHSLFTENPNSIWTINQMLFSDYIYYLLSTRIWVRFLYSKLLLFLLFKCIHIRKLCVTASVSIKNFRLRCRKSRKLIVQRNGKSKLFSFACGSISNCTQFLCRALESEYAVHILCSLFERQLFFYVAFHTITWHLTLRWSLADAKLLCSSLPACSNAAGITAQQFGCCIVESLPER